MIETAARLNTQAIQLANAGSYKEAIACFVKAIKIEKNNATLWFNLGLTYRDSGNFQSAVETLKKAHEISPENAEIIEELSTILYTEGFLDEAQEYCLDSLKINPESYRLFNIAGVIFFNQELYEKASFAFENAVMINPYYSDALYNLRDTYNELNNKTGADECAKRLKELKRNEELNVTGEIH